MRAPSRRAVLRWGAAAGAMTVAPAAAYGSWLYARADHTNVGSLAFRNRLRIPPLLEPERTREGGKRFRLSARPGESELLAGNWPGRRPRHGGTTARTWGPLCARAVATR